MNWESGLAIYLLIWVMSALLVLPFNARHGEATDERVPGQADGAPGGFPALRIAVQTTVLATILFALFAANYDYGWVTVDMLDFYN